MIHQIERIQHTLLKVEADSSELAFQKARDNDVLETRVGATVYRVQDDNIVFPKVSREWPVILRPMKLLATKDDKGLGDIIARTIGPVGGDAFKKWYKKIFGRECGCDTRQEFWNITYPLQKEEV